MTPEVERAISQIEQTFSGHLVKVEAEAQGGAYVIVHDLFLGKQYVPSSSWVGFTISYAYPHADVYPHYLDAELRRVDGLVQGAGLSVATWQNRQVIQVSRRSNRWNAAIDTAATKLCKVLEWLRSR
ncbi:E2/UBC family protein [Calothrix sp. UHCC 0171]|uniref:E2/UBC family protein n=1 Tax=Calothrix sp. UHCC 0171 TaxID=3110245 RepID=UPI002B1FA2A3|nr:E2/UBC family protein [Calothrix sp. UHCC 0171]MEA5574451.1 E2/UBC family protein [Calothrix sp. UHCC 0171]